MRISYSLLLLLLLLKRREIILMINFRLCTCIFAGRHSLLFALERSEFKQTNKKQVPGTVLAVKSCEKAKKICLCCCLILCTCVCTEYHIIILYV